MEAEVQYSSQVFSSAGPSPAHGTQAKAPRKLGVVHIAGDTVDQAEVEQCVVEWMGEKVRFRCVSHKEAFCRLTGRGQEYIAAYIATGSPTEVARRLGVKSVRQAGKTTAHHAKKMGLSGVKDLREPERQSGMASRLMDLIRDQQFKCALTGVPIDPSNAELDHKMPLSRGGTDDIANLQWVSSQANRAKGALSQPEFIEMCKLVAGMNATTVDIHARGIVPPRP